MKNAEKFQEIFKEFATEVWAFPEKDFLTWLNAEYIEPITKNDSKLCPDRKGKTTHMETLLHCVEDECVAYKDGKCLKYNSDQEPTTKNNLGVEEVTALAEWIEKLTKASEDAYSKGYADGMKELGSIMTKDKFKYGLMACGCLFKDGKTWYEHNELIKCFEDLGLFERETKNCSDCEIVQACVEAGIRSTSKALSILDKIRAEIETKYGQCDICEYFEDYDYEENDISEYRPIGNIADILQIIDKYKAESED